MNVTPLPPPTSKLRVMLDQIKRDWLEQVELLELMAKLDHEKFGALVKAGFNAVQAMDLLKAEKIKASITSQ